MKGVKMQLSETEMNKLLIINQVKNRSISQEEGGKELNLSTRQVRRLLSRFCKEGAMGIKSKHKGGNLLLAVDIKEKILALVRERYADFGPTFAAEKLLEKENLKVSKETLRQ